ncbi:hypothetical protein DUI87_28098 [Hirundo rustica rustica]|uniref:phosphatidylinositol-3,4,5-trisphosphate 5-phosphatase n=1 Tax=Hirundo rustica rustica TaxID=333673 RepID=A0A3M0J3U1_HIRRU|nr:hypothetical protein DUI87_28098 [Hirundo rustica rustica]
MAAAGWYHGDISQVVAEELLAKAGRDGSFLVRDSESVKGAYALCLLFQRHVYTYRILPDDEGLLSVQTIQGIQAKCFRTLPDLIGAYQHPNNGLVAPLLHPVHRPRQEEDSGPGGSVPRAPAAAAPQHRARATACRALHSEIDFTLAGLETLARVFDAPVSPRSPAREQGFLSSDPDLEMLLNKISTVNHLLSSLDKKVLKSLQEMVTRHNLALPSVAVAPLPAARPLAVQNFEVKAGKSQRAALTVDVESGTVTVSKRGGSSPEEVIPQDKILQLIKYQSVQGKVRLVCARENQKSLSRDFIFPSARKREAFCQLLQLMKIQHSNLDEPEIISVYVGTWNMGSTPPPRSLASWLTSRGLGRTQDETTACIPHDIYVVGTQENSLGDREWVEFLCASLKTLMAIDYRVVALQCLWSIKIVVLVKPEHQRRISHVHTSSVKTGIANTLGNKGAVGVSFLFNGTSFGFVNCHLASGSEKTHRRNQNYSDILHSLALGDKRLAGFDPHPALHPPLLVRGPQLHRLDMDVQDILTHIVKKEFQALLAVDQLNLEREKSKVFLRFSEGDISFPPTYRYERGTRDSYVWQKSKPTGMRINVPSWCDRILWKSHTGDPRGCTDDIVTSDHSPVFATFAVGVTSQFVPKEAPGSSPEALACIEWESIEVILKTTSRSKCYIEFHSYCLRLNPILPDLEYLATSTCCSASRAWRAASPSHRLRGGAAPQLLGPVDVHLQDEALECHHHLHGQPGPLGHALRPVLPTLVYYYADRNNWPFGTGLCKMVRFLFYANLYSSILFLTCISVHRYMGICHPIRSLKWVKTKQARIICVAAWLVVIVCLIPNLIFVTTSSKGNITLCHDTTKCPRTSPPRPPDALLQAALHQDDIVVLAVFAICFVPFHITRTLYYTSRYFQADCRTLNIINFTYKITRAPGQHQQLPRPILYFMAGDKYPGPAAPRGRPAPPAHGHAGPGPGVSTLRGQPHGRQPRRQRHPRDRHGARRRSVLRAFRSLGPGLRELQPLRARVGAPKCPELGCPCPALRG